MEFWTVRTGARAPFEESKLSYQLPENTKPFIFHTEEFSEGECPAWNVVPGYYSELLKANPGARGHVVIKAGTRNRFAHRRREILNAIVGKGSVSQKRLRFFFVPDRSTLCHPNPCSEYWIVP